MRLIYHLIPPAAWPPRPPGLFRAASLETEGFIHCSNRDQVARVANMFYREQPALVALCIDADRLAGSVRDEDGGAGEFFPHVYGPIGPEAVVEVQPLSRDEDRRWVFPARDDAQGLKGPNA